MRRPLLPLLLALLVLSGCRDTSQDEAAIRGVMTRYAGAWGKRDVKTLCSLVTPATNAAFKRRGAGCEGSMRTILSSTTDHALQQAGRVRINAVRVRGADDAIVEYTGGNGVTRLKKVAGHWLIDGAPATTA